MPNVGKIASGIAKLISNAAVSTTTKKRITAAAERGLTPRQVAELVVRNEAKAAKALAAKGIKTKPKRYEYQGTGYSDRQLDAAFRASPEEGSVAAMARRMAAENPETAAKKAAEKARVVMARNRAQTVARTAKKRALTTTAPKVKRASTKKPTRPGSAEEAALVAKRVRPPAGYSGAKVVKPVKRVTKPVDTSVKVVKPASKRTLQEVKDAKEAARKRRIAANARGRITGKDSVTRRPARPSVARGPEEAARSARTRRAVNKNKNRADEQESDDILQGYWVPANKAKGTERQWISTEKDAGLMPGGGRSGKSITKREPDRRNRDTEDDRGPKDELAAIKKAFAELSKEEKAAMRDADARAIQGILREKIVKGPNRKPAGPKDAPKRKYVTPDRRIETAKARIRARRAAETARNKRLEELKKKLTPAQRKAIAEAVARAKRNSK